MLDYFEVPKDLYEHQSMYHDTNNGTFSKLSMKATLATRQFLINISLLLISVQNLAIKLQYIHFSFILSFQHVK